MAVEIEEVNGIVETLSSSGRMHQLDRHRIWFDHGTPHLAVCNLRPKLAGGNTC